MYDYDAIVVGSGAGGGAIAYKLAASGKKVAIIEAGEFYNTDAFNRFELLAFRRMWWDPRWTSNYERNGGGKPTREIALGMGRCVGGSTTIFTAVAHRAPRENFKDWYDATHVLNERGEPLTYEDIEPNYARAEMETSVRKYTDWDRGVQKISAGFSKLGLNLLPVNAYIDTKCDHSGCLFGCPTGAKKGSLLAYVIPALYLDANLIPNSTVTEVLLRPSQSGERKVEAYGVKFLDPEGVEKSLTSKIVVLSAGALQTPQILFASRIKEASGFSKSSKQIGKNLAANTATIMFGRFEETLNNWELHPLSAHLIDFALEQNGGFILEMSTCMQGPLGFARVLADEEGQPMFGAELRRVTKQYRHMAGIFMNVHDANDGEVFLDEADGRRCKFYKPVTDRDYEKIKRARKLSAEGLAEAGAKETFNSGLLSHHIQGTCRMGEDVDRSVVNSRGEMHDVSRLFVCDASLIPSLVDANPSLTIYALADRIARLLIESSPYLK